MAESDRIVDPINDSFDQVVSSIIEPVREKPIAMSPPNFQIPFPLVKYEIEHKIIHQRVKDGFINATAMCKATSKQWNDYWRLKGTPEYLHELSSETGVPVSGLVQSIKGGVPDMQGTWVHPQVAIHLAQWLSPKFAVKVSKWVFDWMSGKIPDGNLPNHLRCYISNMHNVPNGHFSILNEMTMALIGPLEQMGYTIPDSMVPDISEGRMFSGWLRKNGFDPDNMPNYYHTYEDGLRVQARAYPNSVLEEFRRHFIEVWMAKRSFQYFGERDPKAVPYIENLLALPNYSDIAGFIE